MKTHDNMKSINTGMVSLLETHNKITLKEILRLAEIGKAAELAFQQTSANFDWYDNYICHDNNYSCAVDTDGLLEWYRRATNENCD